MVPCMTEGKGHLRKQFGDFPGRPGVKTPSFHFRGMQIGSLVWNKDPAGHATWPKKKKIDFGEECQDSGDFQGQG